MQRYQEEQKFVDREIELLRGVNKLTYLPPSMAGLIQTRTNKSYPFSNQIAGWGQTVIMNNNTGNDHCYGPNCFLRLAWTVPAGDAAAAAGGYTMDFGYGSIMNCIREVILTHSSGQVLEQINYTNILAAIKTRYYTSVDDQEKLNSLLGGTDSRIDASPPVATAATYNSDLAGGFIANPVLFTNAGGNAVNVAKVGNQTTSRVSVVAAGAGNPVATTYVSMIPMSYLLGVFDRKDQLIPASLLAGSTLQIRFETQNSAASYTTYAGVVNAGAQTFFAGVTFQPSVVYDSCQLFDDVSRAILQEQASVDGLQFTYSTYFPIQQSFNGTGVNFDVQCSASVTQDVIAVVSDTITNATTSGNLNFLFPNIWSQYQWRIASDYKPQQPVTIPGQFICSEAYQYALGTWQDGLHAYDNVDQPNSGSSMTLYQYGTFAALLGTTLERSPVGLQLTGVPTNNAALLNLSATKTAPAAFHAHNITVFLHYLRVANTRGGSVTVDR